MGKVALGGRSGDEEGVSIDLQRQPQRARAGSFVSLAHDYHVLNPKDRQGLVREEGLGRGRKVEKVDMDRSAGAREGEDGFGDLDVERDDWAKAGAPDDSVYATQSLGLVMRLVCLLEVRDPEEL